MNKASRGNRIPTDLFWILKDDTVKVLHSICQQIWKIPQWPQDWKMSVFLPISKKGNAKECSDYCTIAVASHNSKVVLKICPARLQQYVSQELSDVQAGLRKYKGTRDQSANICWIMVKTREFHKNIYFCFIDYAKVFDYVQVSRSVMSDSLQPHGPQHTKLPYPLPTPGACSNSSPSSQWCHPVAPTCSGKQTHSEGRCR